MSDLESYLQDNPGAAKFPWRAHQLAKKGKIDQAVDILRRGLEAAPNNSAAHSVLGAILLLKEEEEDAIQELELAISLDPQSPADLMTLGKYFLKNNDHEKAVRYLWSASRFEPDNAKLKSSFQEALELKKAAEDLNLSDQSEMALSALENDSLDTVAPTMLERPDELDKDSDVMLSETLIAEPAGLSDEAEIDGPDEGSGEDEEDSDEIDFSRELAEADEMAELEAMLEGGSGESAAGKNLPEEAAGEDTDEPEDLDEGSPVDFAAATIEEDIADEPDMAVIVGDEDDEEDMHPDETGTGEMTGKEDLPDIPLFDGIEDDEEESDDGETDALDDDISAELARLDALEQEQSGIQVETGSELPEKGGPELETPAEIETPEESISETVDLAADDIDEEDTGIILESDNEEPESAEEVTTVSEVRTEESAIELPDVSDEEFDALFGGETEDSETDTDEETALSGPEDMSAVIAAAEDSADGEIDFSFAEEDDIAGAKTIAPGLYEADMPEMTAGKDDELLQSDAAAAADSVEEDTATGIIEDLPDESFEEAVTSNVPTAAGVEAALELPDVSQEEFDAMFAGSETEAKEPEDSSEAETVSASVYDAAETVPFTVEGETAPDTVQPFAEVDDGMPFAVDETGEDEETEAALGDIEAAGTIDEAMDDESMTEESEEFTSLIEEEAPELSDSELIAATTEKDMVLDTVLEPTDQEETVSLPEPDETEFSSLLEESGIEDDSDEEPEGTGAADSGRPEQMTAEGETVEDGIGLEESLGTYEDEVSLIVSDGEGEEDDSEHELLGSGSGDQPTVIKPVDIDEEKDTLDKEFDYDAVTEDGPVLSDEERRELLAMESAEDADDEIPATDTDEDFEASDVAGMELPVMGDSEESGDIFGKLSHEELSILSETPASADSMETDLAIETSEGIDYSDVLSDFSEDIGSPELDEKMESIIREEEGIDDEDMVDSETDAALAITEAAPAIVLDEDTESESVEPVPGYLSYVTDMDGRQPGAEAETDSDEEESGIVYGIDNYSIDAQPSDDESISIVETMIESAAGTDFSMPDDDDEIEGGGLEDEGELLEEDKSLDDLIREYESSIKTPKAAEKKRRPEIQPAASAASTQTGVVSKGSPLKETNATMAEIYVSQGLLSQAIRMYEELLAGNPENETIFNRLEELRDMFGSETGE